MLHAVIMAGGSGTRFWPMSRQNRPKHLLALAGPQTLLQQTAARIAPLVPAQRTLVVTGADHAAAVGEQLSHLAADAIVAEPCRRDTAPCIGLAATIVLARDPGATMVVLPADHVIEPADQFRRAAEVATRLVEQDATRLITFGVKPDRPATGYGYIQRGARVGGEEPAVFRVQAFREKPALELAEQYVASGDYYWNSGIFVWAARTIVDELRASRPSMHAALERIGAAWHGSNRGSVLAREYEAIERVSIDYAVMERATNVLVVEAPFRWDDVGSWGAVRRLHGTDADGNTVLGGHCGIGTRSSIVISEPGHLVATLGVDNLVIVHAGNATLVADRRQEESVKRLVELIQRQGLGTYV